MRAMAGSREVAVVFGARNVGRAVARERTAAGWRVIAVARTEETLAALGRALPDVETRRADASDSSAVEEVLAEAGRLGELSLVVNAVTAPPRGGPFGGGPIAAAAPQALDAWLAGFVPAAWAIQRAAGAALSARGAGTIVQVAGGSARRAMPGRGMWAAAQYAARALTLSLAQELRPAGVHVALLVADGMIETERRPLGESHPDELLRPEDVASAVAYLEAQSPRGWTHELTITPRLDNWSP
jgi:NADP-dependent 3-hydroxy acid dehydrogenase YdfG